MSAPLQLGSKALMDISWALDNLGKIATENGVFVGSGGTIVYTDPTGLGTYVEFRVAHDADENGKVTYRLDDRIGQ